MKKQVATLTLSLILSTSSFPQGMGHDASGGYTDEEHTITQDYIHEGKVKEATQAGVEELTQQFINQGMSEDEARAQAEGIVGGTAQDYNIFDNISLEMVAQLYSVVTGAMPGDFTAKVAYTTKEVNTAYGKKWDNLIENAPDTSNPINMTPDEIVADVTDDGRLDVEAWKKAGANEEQAKFLEDANKTADSHDKAIDKAVDDKSDTEKEVSDYCKFIAIGGEVIAGFKSQMDQETIAATPVTKGNEQIEALYAAKATHVAEAENCQTKTITWGATAACYLVMITTSGVLTVSPAGDFANPKEAGGVALKLAASTTLAVLYEKAREQHQGNADKVQNIIAQMPNKGDCNPVSARNCYCSHDSSKNDAKYCAPQMHNRAVAKNAIRSACINNKLEADPTCGCIATDTCYDKTYMNMMINSGLPSQFAQSSVDTMKGISRGSVSSGNYSDATSGFNSAKRRALAKAAGGMKYKGSLNKKRKENSKYLNSLGMPANISSILASYPNNSTVKKNMKRYTRKSRATARRSYNRGRKSSDGKIVYFGGKNSRKSFKRKSSRRSKIAMRKGAKTSGSNVLTFAEKARQQSQIAKDTERPIFETISRRYQVSGWRELEIGNK